MYNYCNFKHLQSSHMTLTNHRMTFRLSTKFLLSCCLLAQSWDALASGYSYTDLGQGVAWAINSGGQIAGAQSDANNIYHAAIWNNGVATRLDALGAGSSSATSINRYGQAVGYSETSIGSTIHATLWSNGKVTDLGTLGGNNSYASDINDQGQIVGSADTGGRVYRHAAMWQDGKVIDLDPTEYSGASSATAINNSGKVVGALNNQSMTTLVATIWSGSTPRHLYVNNSWSSSANDVNDHGDVTGSYLGSDRNSHAVVWTQEGLLDLGNNGISSSGSAINNHRQVVGYSLNPNSAYSLAYLWDGSNAIDLNSFLSAETRAAGWVLIEATDINDAGTIVGAAINRQTGAQHAFTLAPSPVPEPSNTALMFCGMLIIACSTYRSRRRLMADLT